jgi:hypothetical protein
MSQRDKILLRSARGFIVAVAILPLLSVAAGRVLADEVPQRPEKPTHPDASQEQGKGPWERVSNSDGIVVERRTVPGSNLKEFRGRGIVEAPLGRVLAIIRDAPHRCEWMAQCAADYVVEENEAERVQISYHRTKAPWPVADRDSINRAELRVDLTRHRVFLPFEAIPHPKVPVVKGVIRMPFLRGHWILQPVNGGGGTDVEYQVHANPGGILPEWIANLASKKLPLLTIVGLRKQAKLRSYPEFEAQIARSTEAKQMAASGSSVTAPPEAEKTPAKAPAAPAPATPPAANP